ncbi:anti-sigma factor [Sinorhizobium alkalisoli]|uniref:Anti-sigma factor n=1 Tax=Sinorhizobium alkalisoli TaxID=1752398 RepID=A0A1E3V9Y3_9HYPH|nr:anti-sigma factor [Sinorhizobium alkalisoli]MCG5477457.1 anti-sigma factor [Sinorhizobium alkalisoli]ODR89931.1 anti-sigma factor [Sinorhizobium alkalisoli]
MTTQKPESGDSRRDEVIAGEYVLGVLSDEDRRKVEARMASDSDFAAMVIRWQNNLASFDDAYEQVARSVRGSAPGEQAIVDTPQRPPGLWQSLPLWRSLALASLAAVVVLAASSVGLFGGGTGGASLVADLSGEGNAIDLVARFDPASGRLMVTPVAASQTEEKALELWLIRGTAPAVSLGVLPQSGEGEIPLSSGDRSKVTSGATLAVSVEPPGGSPTGSPSGAVIARGTVRYR